MPTPLTHFVAGAAFSQVSPKTQGRHLRYAFVFGVLAALPDLDFAAFFLGIPYGHPLGHRGFSHSLAFAAVLGIIGALILRADRNGARSFWTTAIAACAAAASHGLLDMVTNGGLGVGILMPFDVERFFFPFRPILVSPFSPSTFFAVVGSIMKSEILWVWLPLAVGSTAFQCGRIRWNRGRTRHPRAYDIDHPPTQNRNTVDELTADS